MIEAFVQRSALEARCEKFSGVFVPVEESIVIAGVCVRLSHKRRVLEMTAVPLVMY
jgi:hypothetical protein